jgi:hypothetical protein
MDNSTRPDLANPYPAGHPSGRICEPPASAEQARARVLAEMDHLEANCRDGIDVGYALRCLAEAVDDYTKIVLGA